MRTKVKRLSLDLTEEEHQKAGAIMPKFGARSKSALIRMLITRAYEEMQKPEVKRAR